MKPPLSRQTGEGVFWLSSLSVAKAGMICYTVSIFIHRSDAMGVPHEKRETRGTANMSDKRYDVFISYRRREGAKEAFLIYYALKSKGYDVFLDVELLKSGSLQEHLEKAIGECDDFVPVLSPGTLDPRQENVDWVRFELETAFKLNKNIIPITLNAFHFPNGLSGELKNLVDRVRVGFPSEMEYFDAFIVKLVPMLRSKPRYRLVDMDERIIPTEKATELPKPPIIVQKGEISDSWTEILAAIDDGSVKKRYAVGAWKLLDLGMFGTVNMQLAGFDLDDRADGTGKAATTWIARELLAETHAMCKDRDILKNGWWGSDLRKWLQGALLPAFPNELCDRLLPIKKQQGGSRAAVDRLWIPSFLEIFGDDSMYYGLFQNEDSNRVKMLGGSAEWWWLRSANYYDFFFFVTCYGNDYSISSHYSGGVVLGFCL